MTGNRPRPTQNLHSRHDVLAAELALRAASALHIGTVLGPHFSTFNDLQQIAAVPHRAVGGADLTIVRSDGLRIAVEITATITGGFEEKVDHWVKVLSRTTMETHALVVVFLVASSTDGAHSSADRTRRKVYRQIETALRKIAYPGSTLPVARIGVATWPEWFPSILTASDRFVNLAVDRPIGIDRGWEQCDLADPAALPLPAGADTADLRAVIPAASLLAQTPAWLRHDHQPARLAVDMLRATADPLPVTPRRDRSATREVGAGQGAAGDAALPPRLAGPVDQAVRARSQPVAEARALRRDLPEPTFGHRLKAISHQENA